MSLLIIAFSQADNKAIVNSYNTGYRKETKSFMWTVFKQESAGPEQHGYYMETVLKL